MGGDYYGSIVSGVFEYRAPELSLARNVETVGRLIEEKVSGSTGKGKGNVAFLELAAGHLVHLAFRIVFQFLHYCKEFVLTVVRPEDTVGSGPAGSSVIYRCDLILKEENIGQE